MSRVRVTVKDPAEWDRPGPFAPVWRQTAGGAFETVFGISEGRIRPNITRAGFQVTVYLGSRRCCLAVDAPTFEAAEELCIAFAKRLEARDPEAIKRLA